MPRLLTLGTFVLLGDDASERAPISVQPKRLALLAYLATASAGGFHRRDTLLGLFWPELADDEARRALRQALYHLRRTLGEGGIVARPDDQLGLGPVLACDATELERLLDAGRPEAAVALYRGDFLQGVYVPDVAQEFEEWVDHMRSRLRGRVVDAARRALTTAEGEGRLTDALAMAFRAHALAPADEDLLRRLLTLQQRTGDVDGVQRVFQTFARRMRDEYGAAPQPATLELIEALRLAPPVVLPPSPALAADAVPLAAESPASFTSADPGPSAPATGATTAVSAARRWQRAPRLLLAAGVIGIALAAVVARRAVSVDEPTETLIGRGLLKSRDRVLVAEMRSSSGDTSLALALGRALQIDLAQTRVVEIVGGGSVRRALRRMGQPADLGVRDSVVREVALRAQAEAYVVGQVEAVGGAYVLSAQLLDARKGEVLAAVRATARDSSDFLEAVDRLSAGLRRQIGEALGTIENEPPLRGVTTPSLAALSKFSQGSELMEGSVDDRAAARRLFEEAVGLDTNFATAYKTLGSLYRAQGEFGKSAAALGRAFALRDRLPQDERDYVMASYYRNVTHEYDKAAAAWMRLLAVDSNDVPVLNNLALVYKDARQFDRAEALYRRAIALDSTTPALYNGLIVILALTGRTDETRAMLADAARRFPESRTRMLAEIEAATAQRDWTAVERLKLAYMDHMRDSPHDQMESAEVLGRVTLLTGRLDEATAHLQRAIRLAEGEGSRGHLLRSAVTLAWLELRYRGRRDSALHDLAAVLQRHPLDSLQVPDRPYVQLAQLYLEARQPERIMALREAAARDPEARRLLRRSVKPWLDGLALLATSRAREAIDLLREAEALDECTMCVLPDLARAYEEAGDPDGATTTYDRYLGTPWIARHEVDAWAYGWSLLRAGELLEKEGQISRATTAYEQLLALWRPADEQLAPVQQELRGRLAKLRGPAQ
ncbi:MAG TPA: tetratricopeptide repeat protein [Gemmatimonadales bacterium]|nr:tetratricopeptide repeat protein [Gemmatimonadales bacterium]